MDWLTRDPPSKVNVCGVPVPIRTGWKRAVRSLVLQGDRDRIPLVDADEMLGSWFSRDGVIPPEVLGHWYEALTAALGWRDTAMRTALPYGERDAGQPRARVFDWEADSGIVVVDFRRIYGIDLATAQMHWWRFALLFDGICATPGSLVSTAMSARRPIGSGAGRPERDDHERAAAAWALPLSDAEATERRNARVREAW